MEGVTTFALENRTATEHLPTEKVSLLVRRSQARKKHVTMSNGLLLILKGSSAGKVSR